jgi:hypothetical protein
MLQKYFISSLLVALLIAVAFVNTSYARPSFNASLPVSGSAWALCLNNGQGDVINLSGNEHFLVDETTDNSGGVHLTLQSNTQGVTGTSQTTGQKYQGIDTHIHTLTSRVGQTQTIEDNFLLIGQGRSTNLLVHQLIHVNINSVGTVTLFVDHFSLECR